MVAGVGNADDSVRALNTMWALNPGAAVRGDWTWYDVGVTVIFF